MKNKYYVFDTLTEFGNLTEDFFDGLESFFAYVRIPRLGRTYRLEIRRTSGDFPWYVAKLFYKGSRSPLSRTGCLTMFGVVRRLYEFLKW